jgi:hypothetical protein
VLGKNVSFLSILFDERNDMINVFVNFFSCICICLYSELNRIEFIYIP